MKKLENNFSLERYGLYVRLVLEDDAEFINDLRQDLKLSRFISPTEDNVDKQKEWIRNYKHRERAGEDNYFIYYHNGKPIGVNRIYDIKDNSFIHGSWIFIPDTLPYCSLAAAVIAREIAFYNLGLEIEIDTAGIHVDNTGVLQFAQYMGEEFTGSYTSSLGEFKTGILTKESFENNKNKIIKLFPKNVR